ncbi:hypothetical protein B0J12DRAFT_268953 [Macrophomina phaseolina]|uniref:Uncharacterized protein n=1 Tax=Macrophomina phaseolina TaxID=35725 RepID=A0ABQ8FY83_9PEZI|nr:hypothetical protein B0J12DRAFT_268953 [Macrophomina phaseolina]
MRVALLLLRVCLLLRPLLAAVLAWVRGRGGERWLERRESAGPGVERRRAEGDATISLAFNRATASRDGFKLQERR